MNRPRSRRGPRGKFADRLRMGRERLGLTQEGAASALGVHRVTLAKWESGEDKPRGLALRFVEGWIAKALGEED